MGRDLRCFRLLILCEARKSWTLLLLVRPCEFCYCWHRDTGAQATDSSTPWCRPSSKVKCYNISANTDKWQWLWGVYSVNSHAKPLQDKIWIRSSRPLPLRLCFGNPTKFLHTWCWFQSFCVQLLKSCQQSFLPEPAELLCVCVSLSICGRMRPLWRKQKREVSADLATELAKSSAEMACKVQQICC